VPLVVLSPATTAFVFAAYVGHGRFSMPKDAVVLDLHDAATTAFLEAEPVGVVAALKAPAVAAGAPRASLRTASMMVKPEYSY